MRVNSRAQSTALHRSATSDYGDHMRRNSFAGFVEDTVVFVHSEEHTGRITRDPPRPRLVQHYKHYKVEKRRRK